jgi:hypothetical protein
MTGARPKYQEPCVFEPIGLNITDDITIELNGDIFARIP